MHLDGENIGAVETSLLNIEENHTRSTWQRDWIHN
jgi:hypothetical protein